MTRAAPPSSDNSKTAIINSTRKVGITVGVSKRLIPSPSEATGRGNGVEDGDELAHGGHECHLSKRVILSGAG